MEFKWKKKGKKKGPKRAFSTLFWEKGRGVAKKLFKFDHFLKFILEASTSLPHNLLEKAKNDP